MDFSRVNTYIRELYDNNDSLNRRTYINCSETKDFVPVVDDDVARMLKLLLRIARPARILEIGTSIGYSTVSMAMVAKEYGGRIVTVEYDERVAAHARKNFEKAGVSDLIDVVCGDAAQVIPNLEGDFDMVFQDVDKRLYPVLFKDCLRILKQGGLFVAEDVLFPAIDLDPQWHNLIKPIAEFNTMAVENEWLESTLLPIGDGLLVAVKR